MKLDPRIKNGYKPLDCFDTEYSEVLKPFLQKEGYFSNNLRNFLNLNSCKKGCLVNVFAKNFDCFVCFADDSNSSYKFFIPEAWVKYEEPEKKYRSYKNVQELFEDIGVYIGDIIHFRSKAEGTESHSLITSYTTLKDGTEKICLGGAFYYTMQALFDLFEWQKSNGEWQPFGVEDKE